MAKIHAMSTVILSYSFFLHIASSTKVSITSPTCPHLFTFFLHFLERILFFNSICANSLLSGSKLYVQGKCLLISNTITDLHKIIVNNTINKSVLIVVLAILMIKMYLSENCEKRVNKWNQIDLSKLTPWWLCVRKIRLNQSGQGLYISINRLTVISVSLWPEVGTRQCIGKWQGWVTGRGDWMDKKLGWLMGKRPE